MLADFHPRDAWIVVARARVDVRCPVVHVNVLYLRSPPSNSVRHEQMVELLRILVEQVRVPLNGVNAGALIDLRKQPVERGEHGARLHILIAVSADDDARPWVLCEQRADERL